MRELWREKYLYVLKKLSETPFSLLQQNTWWFSSIFCYFVKKRNNYDYDLKKKNQRNDPDGFDGLKGSYSAEQGE